MGAQWSKDLALPQLLCRSQLQLRSNPWNRNSVYLRAAEKEKKKEKNFLSYARHWIRPSDVSMSRWPYCPIQSLQLSEIDDDDRIKTIY